MVEQSKVPTEMSIAKWLSKKTKIERDQPLQIAFFKILKHLRLNVIIISDSAHLFRATIPHLALMNLMRTKVKLSDVKID